MKHWPHHIGPWEIILSVNWCKRVQPTLYVAPLSRKAVLNSVRNQENILSLPTSQQAGFPIAHATFFFFFCHQAYSLACNTLRWTVSNWNLFPICLTHLNTWSPAAIFMFSASSKCSEIWALSYSSSTIWDSSHLELQAQVNSSIIR